MEDYQPESGTDTENGIMIFRFLFTFPFLCANIINALSA